MIGQSSDAGSSTIKVLDPRAPWPPAARRSSLIETLPFAAFRAGRLCSARKNAGDPRPATLRDIAAQRSHVAGNAPGPRRGEGKLMFVGRARFPWPV